MKGKLIIENREFYFHPKFKTFAGSVDGYIVDVKNQKPTLGILCENGYYTVEFEDGWWMYANNFIWECFHGLLKFNEKVKHINKQKNDNRLENLKMKSNEIFLKCSTDKTLTYV